MNAGGGVQGEKRVGIAEQACRRGALRACMRGGGMEEVEHAPAVVWCLRIARGAGRRRRAVAGLALVWGGVYRAEVVRRYRGRRRGRRGGGGGVQEWVVQSGGMWCGGVGA